jgi:hypothetical protein
MIQISASENFRYLVIGANGQGDLQAQAKVVLVTTAFVTFIAHSIWQ